MIPSIVFTLLAFWTLLLFICAISFGFIERFPRIQRFYPNIHQNVVYILFQIITLGLYIFCLIFKRVKILTKRILNLRELNEKLVHLFR